ncbi:transposon Ty3-I Gag-Pol polyprotein [Trichonephila clavipes]|nr:transposon Ty3-I Gag-Pol polyprotein [Trichonephila clavipes]
MPKEVKRSTHEKRLPGIKENKDYYFIPKLRQKVENSIANCDHRILRNHKGRKKESIFNPLQKEDMPLKTYHTDHLGPNRIINFKEGVMEHKMSDLSKIFNSKQRKTHRHEERRTNKIRRKTINRKMTKERRPRIEENKRRKPLKIKGKKKDAEDKKKDERMNHNPFENCVTDERLKNSKLLLFRYLIPLLLLFCFFYIYLQFRLEDQPIPRWPYVPASISKLYH